MENSLITITGYKFMTEQDALDARNSCDVYYNIPVEPNDETKHWCDFIYEPYQIFWYIIFDSSLEVVLGQPSDFEITNPIPPFSL
jgi:hypothetical protein